MAYAELGQLDDAWRCIDDAIEKVERSKEKWCEAEVHRIAGEIALKSLAPDPEKAEAYFDRALAVARQQQAKSWELRAAMSMARLWRDQGKRNEARDLLAPVYGWFTEGFDTLDLKEAKTLLAELYVIGRADGAPDLRLWHQRTCRIAVEIDAGRARDHAFQIHHAPGVSGRATPSLRRSSSGQRSRQRCAAPGTLRP